MTLEEQIASAIEAAFWDGDTFAKDRCRASVDEQRKTWKACALAAIAAGKAFREATPELREMLARRA